MKRFAYIVVNLHISSASQPQLPEPKTLRGENKTFYFDVGSNRRGIYLRISEVSCLLLFTEAFSCAYCTVWMKTDIINTAD